MPSVVQEQLAKFHRICDMCELDKDNTPEINYRQRLIDKYFKYAEDKVLIALVEVVADKQTLVSSFEEMFKGIDLRAFEVYQQVSRPLIVGTPNVPNSFRVYPNIILDAGTNAASLANVNIIDVASAFSTFVSLYEKDKDSAFFDKKWGNPKDKFEAYQDQGIATVLTSILKDHYKDHQIRDMAQKIENARKPLQLLYAETPEDFTTMYGSGPSSCMSQTGGSHTNWKSLTEAGLCPASFYSYFPYTKGAYIMVNGKVGARCILWRDPKKENVWYAGRIYSSNGELSRKFSDCLTNAGIGMLYENIKVPDGVVVNVPGVPWKGNTGGQYIMPFPYFDNLDYYGKGFTATFNQETKMFTLTYHKVPERGAVPINGRGGFLASNDYIQRTCEACGSNKVDMGWGEWVSTDDGHLYCGRFCANNKGYIQVGMGNGQSAWQKDDPTLIKAEDGHRFTTYKAAYDMGYLLRVPEKGIMTEEYGDIVTTHGWGFSSPRDGSFYRIPDSSAPTIQNLIPLAEIKTQKTVTFNPEESLVVEKAA